MFNFIISKLFLLSIILFQFLIAQGSVMLVGGGGENYGSWSDDPYNWFVEKAGNGKIINIDVDEASEWYPDYFISLGANLNSHNLQIATVENANNPFIYQELLSADGIFIEGGDQWDYISTWKNTLVQTAIEYVYNNGGVIGGTSAGLAILGEVVFDAQYGSLTSDQAAYNPYHYRVSITDDFLSILPGVFTDSHFNDRGRLGRLAVMLARRNQDFEEDLLGIGVEYKTAFCIDENMIGTVHGKMVTIIHQTDSSEIQCIINEPPRFTNILFNQLLDGVQYSLETREVIAYGNWIEPFESEVITAPVFTQLTLNGSESSTANFGQYVITGLTGSVNNWWYGDLEIEDGNGLVPHSVIIPKIWSDYDYFPNRIIGGQYGIVTDEIFLSQFQDKPFVTLFIDDNSSPSISTEGILTVDNLTYVLDIFDATHIGTNSDNMPGIVNGRFHLLANDDQYDLASKYNMLNNDNIESIVTKKIELNQNYPNPFNPITLINYELTYDGLVNITIYDMMGKIVKTLVNSSQTSGYKSIRWNATNDSNEPVSAGLYLYTIEAGEFRQTKKMVLLK